MELLLRNITWQNGTELITGDVRIKKSIIQELGSLSPEKNERVIDFTGHYLYPGLINAHDHLEMNLYPKLGTGLYKNYIEWSQDIYKPDASPVKEIEKVSIKDRLLWGGVKNLISGATSVVHHNPWNSVFDTAGFPVKVLKKMNWAHSLGFGKNITKDFKKDVPFVIHAAEGIDGVAVRELSTLDALDLLQENTVLVHGIALEQDAAQRFCNSKFSLVWCPASNLFMFDRTAPIEKLKGKIRITLGTDSTMTGSPTLLEEMRVAQHSQKATPAEIMNMVTTDACGIFNLPPSGIRPGLPADLFVSPARSHDYATNLLEVTPSDLRLVVVDGVVQLYDPVLGEESFGHALHRTQIGGEIRKVAVDIASLKKRISAIVPSKWLEENPLWNLIGA